MKDKIVNLMKSEGLTPSRLAEILEIQPSGVSHLVSGRNKPGFDLLQKILKRFPQINPDWLLLDSDVMYRVADNESSQAVVVESSQIEPISEIGSVQVTPIYIEPPVVVRQPQPQPQQVVEDRVLKAPILENSVRDSQYIGDQKSSPIVQPQVQFTPREESYSEPIVDLFEDEVVESKPEPVVKSTKKRVVEEDDNSQIVSSIIDSKKSKVVRVILFYDDSTCESFEMR